jgi:hypothetical protein
MTRFTAHFDTARDYIVQFTVTHKLICPQYGVHYRRLVAAFDGGRTRSSGFPNCPWPQLQTASNSISQRLNASCSLTAAKWLLRHDWRLTANHFVLVASPFKLMSSDFSNWTLCRHCPYNHSPLWLDDWFVPEEALPFTSVRIAHIACYCESLLFTAYKSYVSRGFAKQIVSSLLILLNKSGSVTWRLERS